MSRIGKKPIAIPQGVEVKIEGQKVVVRGPKGEISREIRPEIKVEVKDGKIFVSGDNKAFWGLTRALIYNQVLGVTEGYEKKLEIEGVGYRASLEGEDLLLSVGFTQPVKIKKPEGIKFSVEKNVITVSGIDKELVGQISAKIRKVRPPEPYKGKGIRYQRGRVRRKLGKRAVATAT
jgi:large subunit ribosomal protein L6